MLAEKTQQKFGVNFRIEGKVEMKSNQIETQLEVKDQLIPFVTIWRASKKDKRSIFSLRIK